MVNVGDVSIEVPRYFSSIQLDEDTSDGVLILAVYQDKELLTYERIKMGVSGCKLSCGEGLVDGYVYTELLTNAAPRFTPSDIKFLSD